MDQEELLNNIIGGTYKIFTDGSVSDEDPEHKFASCSFVITWNEIVICYGTKGYKNKTITFAELVGVIWGLEEFRRKILPRTKLRPVPIEIHTDSQFVVQGFNDWMDNWRKNDWKSTTGKEVSHKVLFQTIDTMFYSNPEYSIKFFHIPRKLDVNNFNSIMNRKCHTLAKKTTKMLKEKYIGNKEERKKRREVLGNGGIQKTQLPE